MSEMFRESTKTKLYITSILVLVLVFIGGCVFQSQPSTNSSNNGSPRFTSILSLGSTGLALRSDGRVVCWGHNDQGFCDDAQNITNAKSISYPNFVIKKDGKATTIGRVYGNKIPSNLTGVVEITRARLWDLALKDDGTLVAWSPYPGEPSKPVSDAQLAIIENQSALTSISGNLGLKKDGTVVTWFVNDNLLSPYLPGLSNIIAISNQGENYAALRRDGTVVAWKVLDTSPENAGQVIPIHIVENFTDIRAVSAGFDHGLALKRDGTVVSWTDDSLQSTGLTDIAAISAGYPDFAVKNDGSIIAWGGDNKYGQLFTPGKLSNVKSISAGHDHSIVLRNDGTIATWGSDFETLCCMQGSEPEGIRNVTGVLANGQQNLILMNNESIYGWGDPEYGPFPVKQIPHPSLTLFGGHNALFALKNGNLIVLSYNLTGFNISQRLDNVTEVSTVNGGRTIALKKDGTVRAWGDNLYGQNDVPCNLSGVVSVSTHQNYHLVLKNDGTVIGWGNNAVGQTDIPQGLSGVTAIAAGDGHSLALKRDGTVVAWGINKKGECNVPENLHNVVAIAAGSFQSIALKKDGTVVAWGQTVIPDWSG